ncbi:ABC transporter ATP-binding protein [Dictyobacter formicarum]|uniref:HlyB/MsbA family ABC transporter n=1 Tax=Dictyobacter formicarum TaxID=2778368 RepID=A0ABQ3VGK2_9CHLR|nr:ABC transporter ATP-binding protein [Dictyobacter formicarum]GHO85150.1 HlyB/MsbA family ABC transporter [Dictyobacter formicarum]
MLKKFFPFELLNRSLRDLWFCIKLMFTTAPIICTLTLILGCVVGSFPALQIYLTSALIDSLTVRHTTKASGFIAWPALLQSGRLNTTLIWLFLLLSIMLLSNLIQGLQPYQGALLRERVGDRLLSRYYRKAVSLPLASFEEPHIHDTGQRALEGIRRFSRFWGEQVQSVLQSILGALSVLLLLGQVNWLIPPVLILGQILLIKWGFEANKAFMTMNYEQTPQRRQLTYWRSLLTERDAAAEVRLYGLQDHIIAGWRNLNDELMKRLAKLRLHYLFVINRVSILTYSLLGFGLLMLLYAAVHHQITAGSFIALLLGLQQFNTLAGNLQWQFEHAYRSTKEIQYVPAFLNLKSEEFHEAGPAAPSLSQDILFEHVSFTYPGMEHPVLHDLNLRIQPGERIALVGENGAGKSTLAKLLLGLYQPDSGRILVDGIDLHEMQLDSWRAKVGAVFQDFMRYPLSVQENIGLGLLDKKDDLAAIKQAAEKSRASEFIEHLPQSYQTLLGKEFEGGHDLSYGQWQKLAIARAYLREAHLLLLDEPASALDARTEYEVYRQFRDVARSKTIVLISHRLGSARLADRILFLQHGSITEEGTHDELIASNGSYAQLYTMQAEWYQEKAGTAHE